MFSDHRFPNARQELDLAVFVFDALFLIRSRKLVSNTTSAHYVGLIWSDARTRLVIPSHPNLKPHARMLHHFRFLLPLLPKDEDGLSELHYYDSAIQLARTVDREPTEEEYQRGMDAVASILQMCVSSQCLFRNVVLTIANRLWECRSEMLQESRMQTNSVIS